MLTMTAIKVDITGAKRKINRIIRVLNKDDLLRAIGFRQLKWINDNFKAEGGLIKKAGWKALTSNTIAGRRGGSSAILQDTGRLRQSFDDFGVNVSGGAVTVGTRSKIAEYHEKGTDPYIIRPKRAKMLRFVTAGGIVFAKEVHHPGLPKRKMLPTIKIAKELGISVITATFDRVTDGYN